MALYQDRVDAAHKLLATLPEIEPGKAVILALPRGGVPIGDVIAKALNAPLDLILVRKVPSPQNPELALGAVTGAHELTVNDSVRRMLGLTHQDVQNLAATQVEEIERRRDLYLGGKPSVSLIGKTAIVVDDGIATGATALAALKAVKARQPDRIILAVPVASEDVLAELRAMVDQIICPAPHLPYGAVGAAYTNFSQVSDKEVIALLRVQIEAGQAERPA